MKKIIASLCVLTFPLLIFAQSIICDEGYASFYGDEYNGRQTANGEIYDLNNFTAAHRTLPFGSVVEVTNLDNGISVFVRINDRGPFVANREIDLSKAAANAIGMLEQGIARVSIKLISQPIVTNKNSTQGSKNFSTEKNASHDFGNNYKNQTPELTGTTTTKMIYTPATKQKGVVLWRIQLGSFSREENALRLVEALRGIGFDPAYEKADDKVRVVLFGIRDADLENVKSVLKDHNYIDYIILQESW